MARNNRTSNDSDARIGQCIKIARLESGLSQSELGDALGISFQQVQKYERGTNRVAARDIARIAKLLGKPFDYFMGDLGIKRSVKAEQRAKFLATIYGNQIVTEAMKLKPDLQKALIDLARTLA